MQAFVDFFTRVAGDWGLWIVFAVVFLETSAMIGLLVPGETTVLLAGALASQGVLDIGDLVAVVCVAAVLGDSVGYLLGRRLGRDFLLRHSRLFRIKPHHVERTEGFFIRHGGKTILFGRWVGFLRSLGPFIAGSARMHYGRFVAYDVLGAVSWGITVTILGYVFGRSYHMAERWLGRVSLFLLISILVGVALVFLGRWLWARREALGRLADGLTDRVLGWRAVRAVRRRFEPQIAWLLRRFSPSRAYGLGVTTGLLLSLLLAWAFGNILEGVVGREPITVLDRTVARTLHDHAVPWLTSAMIVITSFGGGWVLVLVAFVVTAALVWRRRWGEGLVLLTATSGAAFLNAMLKLLIQRPRPEFLEPLITVGGYSFPSGHASASAAFFMTLGLLAAGWVRRWETRVYVLLGAIGAILLIGFSRLYLGVHYLSDVLAGYALGAFWAVVAITAAMILQRALSPTSTDTVEVDDVSDHHHADEGPGGGSPGGGGQGDGGQGDGGAKLFSPRRAAVLEDERRLQLLSEESLARLLRLEGDEDVADLGSGTGFYSDRIARLTRGTVYAVEMQLEMQEMHRAKDLPGNVELVLADLDELPLADDSIDRAFSVNTFHESHGPEGLERLARALRPGGLFVIVDWRRAEEAAEFGPPLAHRLETAQVRDLLAPWFDVLEEEVVSVPLFAVVARVR
ncbi:MAG: phosphatase PAP2 family protein [Thermoleophilia bacterium]